MSEKLLPCPFCGGQSDIEQTGKNELTIRCVETQTATGLKGCGPKYVQKAARFSLEWLADKMTEKWNRRTPTPHHNVVAWKPVEYDHEVTLQASREASSNVDDADPRRVLLAVLGCAETWTPTARIIGNVRAGDISIALRAALATTTEDQP